MRCDIVRVKLRHATKLEALSRVANQVLRLGMVNSREVIVI